MMDENSIGRCMLILMLSLILYRESESSTGVRPTYDSMSSDLHEYVLSKLVEEQGGLCAYCMCRIPETDKKTGSTLKCTIEHIEPQSLTRGTENLKKELEYSNFLAVCSGNENRGALCCDKSRGNKKLFLTPLNPECNHLIQYSLSGKIQAAETIPDKEDRKELDYELNDILNLNDGKDLKAKRKSALDGMLSVLQKQHKDQDVEECRRKLRELETPRGQKVEYVGILIFWLKKHIQHLESRG